MTDETIKCQLSRRVCGIGCPEFFILTNDKDVPLTKEQLEQVCHSSNAYSDLREQLQKLVDALDGKCPYHPPLQYGVCAACVDNVKNKREAARELLERLK